VIDNDQYDALANADVGTMGGDKLGSVQQVYLDDVTGQPAWVTVRTGLFGGNLTFVPLAGASWDDGTVRVPYEKDFVHDAPNVDADAHLEAEQEAELYHYFRLEYDVHGEGYAGNVATHDSEPATGRHAAPEGSAPDLSGPDLSGTARPNRLRLYPASPAEASGEVSGEYEARHGDT
jgi:hypothetical protein